MGSTKAFSRRSMASAAASSRSLLASTRRRRVARCTAGAAGANAGERVDAGAPLDFGEGGGQGAGRAAALLAGGVEAHHEEAQGGAVVEGIEQDVDLLEPDVGLSLPGARGVGVLLPPNDAPPGSRHHCMTPGERATGLTSRFRMGSLANRVQAPSFTPCAAKRGGS
jgi:hypothetical protein